VILSLLGALSLVASGCTGSGNPGPTIPASPSESPLPDPLTVSTAVAFRSADGVDLAGRLFGDGPNGVVLVHNFDGDQSDWWPFAEILAARGYRALTYDTRGVCPGGSAGCSKGRANGRTFEDVLAAIDLLRDRGARTFALVGGDFGAFQAMQAAGQTGVDVSAVVSVSFLTLFGGKKVVAAVGEPKLFLSGKFDSLASSSIPDLQDWARPIVLFRVVSTDARGSQMFTSVRAGDTAAVSRQIVLDFLELYGRRLPGG